MSRLDKLNKMLEADPGDAFVLYGIAQEHARVGRHDEAIAFYGRCLAADPAYCYAYYHRALSQREAGDTAGAIATLRAGIEAAIRSGDVKARGEMEGLMETLE
jgi:tetratricopeptide (TPR) repeat protein